MFKYLIALAIVGAMSVPAAAQPAAPPQNPPATNQAQPVPQQMVKKTVCEENDNPSTTIHRICHTVMVPAKPNSSASNRAPTANQDPNSGY